MSLMDRRVRALQENIKLNSAGASAQKTMAQNCKKPLGLSPNTAQYEHRNKKEFFLNRDRELSVFDTSREGSDYIVFTGLNETTFNHDCDDNSLGTLGFKTFYPGLELLLVKMELRTHGFAP
ncbi:hypothetical protein TSTA_105350 [Talaromyces stipitatus ATCC 10500]|uniref:Uncharacterized protein n=1 Tax=Talaromyces stipitatus (strain ATCC 10500 / CBS 375.48 / QM 6759 / NRRL 1006) TaxID=441959 RepID=B8MP84_TALSN|nr:uncharacterized protein TSTA_105350 [Talaromyces stipitatus ATCC 10500]EED14323.1 hypothetical protein TSTA_105350 [Talaromyces stipitatus ATCC 10500]